MSVRAKFKVQCITDWGSLKQIKLQAVFAGEIPENQRYHKYTPSGELSITIDNPSASDQFKVGEEFYLDFTNAKGD